MEDWQDAFGHEVYDHHVGREGYEIIERDDGLFDVSGGPAIYFSEYDDWPPHQKEAMTWARGKMLDIGCGAGRHALYLQEQGFDVTGIDQSPLTIKTCKLRGLEKAQVLPITRVSSTLGTFDTLLMLGNNFGLFGGMKRARWLLRRFRSITNEGARIIAESTNPYDTDDPTHLEYHELNRRRGRMGGQVRIRARYRKHVTPWFDYLLASQDEVRTIVEGTKWRVREFLDSADSAAYVAIIEREA